MIVSTSAIIFWIKFKVILIEKQSYTAFHNSIMKHFGNYADTEYCSF